MHALNYYTAKPDACSEGVTLLTGHLDVGGSCPESSYQHSEIYCCCGHHCCWDKCTWDVPPEDCLKEVQNSQWVYHARLGYYIAIQNWNGASSVGIHDSFLPCPEGTKSYGDTCCCYDGCCWNECWSDPPPDECLSKIPGSV